MGAGVLSQPLKGALRSFPAGKAAGAQMDALFAVNKGRAAGATITIGAEAANVRNITIQLTDENGDAIDHQWVGLLVVFADAAGAALATTGGSTGIEIGTDGLIVATHTAKKVFLVGTEADGDLDLTWTDTGTEEVFLGLVMPNGKVVMSASIANAA